MKSRRNKKPLKAALLAFNGTSGLEPRLLILRNPEQDRQEARAGDCGEPREVG